ncbi:MAG: hypothetical protein ACRD2Z_10180 [Thermoanaerobaculia bacterium]
MMRFALWIALAAGLAAAFGLHLIRDFVFWHASLVGAAVALLTWSVLRTGRRLKNLYRPPE